MIVLRTHLVDNNGYIQPLYECENGVWFEQVEVNNVDLDKVTRLQQILPAEAKKLIDKKIYLEF
jgi:hypothetical protein